MSMSQDHEMHEQSEPEAAEHGPLFDTHGMLVLGGHRTDSDFSSPVYVSHLPMFMTPHDFQVIVRVGGEAAARYQPFVAHFGLEPFYTFEPEQFSIDELDPADGGPARTSFGGTLTRGHFERRGTAIATDVAFDVEQVILYRRFRPRPTRCDELRYLCFGERDAVFMAHFVCAPPDFDQILMVDVQSFGDISAEALRAGVVVTIPGHRNDVKHRLKPGEAATAKAAGGSLELTVASEYYLETRDLEKPM